jgi:malate dehydrogenase (oxaloacetate-decarboxylating)(NADP+)
MEYNGKTYYPGQGNNMYIFPGELISFKMYISYIGTISGLGLGAILSRAYMVTDSMVEASSVGLADSLTLEEKADNLLYPRVSRIRDISMDIAFAVIRAAQKAVSSVNPNQHSLN